MAHGETLPFGLWASAVLAALPIITVFGLLAARKVAGHWAALVGALLAALLALAVWQLPFLVTLAAGVYGMALGVFPITYIIAGSLLLYNLTVVSGWAERLRATLGQLVPDRYLLLLLIGFGFVAFLDSTAGFLTPVTVATALLAGLGVPAFEGAAYALVASSLPPIFGAMGIPVVVLAEVSDLPLTALAHRQAIIAAGLFAGFPAWLTITFGGWPALRRLWLHAAAAGIAYALVIWWVADQISLYPAGLAASVASLLAIVAVVNWSGQSRRHGEQLLSLKNVLMPWWPYLLLMVLVTAWSVPPLNGWLNRLTATVPMPALPSSPGIRLDLAASPGTAILLAALLIGGAARISAAGWRQAGLTTLRQLRYPLINMMAMLALAQIMNFSGMTAALGLAVASTGQVFPLISPYLSWLGAAIAGSNTAANAMLGQLQATTASQLGLEPLTVVALAGAAAPLGKMVAPQVLSAASSAGGLVNMEGKLLRIGLFHSLIWTGFIALVGWVAAWE